jgi:transposase
MAGKGRCVRDDGYRIADWLWERIEPLLPEPPEHPLGCHRPRVLDRAAMDAIFFVLRTGCQWNALSATGMCSSSSAHRRFQEWTRAGVFEQLWQEGLLDYDERRGVAWSPSVVDTAMVKAPLSKPTPAPIPLTERSRARNGVSWWTAEACPPRS